MSNTPNNPFDDNQPDQGYAQGAPPQKKSNVWLWVLGTIGVLGHSFGGFTSCRATELDDRIQAIVPMTLAGTVVFEEGEERKQDEDQTTSDWSASFFEQDDPLIAYARKACPLRCTGGNTFSFIHKSFFEFFVTKTLLSVMEKEGKEEELFERLNKRDIQQEPVALNFLRDAFYGADQEEKKKYRDALLQVVCMTRGEQGEEEKSNSNSKTTKAGANALTILNWARVMLMGYDFSESTARGSTCTRPT